MSTRIRWVITTTHPTPPGHPLNPGPCPTCAPGYPCTHNLKHGHAR